MLADSSVLVNSIVIFAYLLITYVFAKLSMSFMHRRKYDFFRQLLPLLLYLFISSVLIAFIGYGSLQETPFFRLVALLSLLAVLLLLFVIVILKRAKSDAYDQLLKRFEGRK